MGTTTLSVKEPTAERFHDLKAALDEVQDAPDHTVDSFMQALLDTWEAADDGYYDSGEIDIERIEARLDELQTQLPTDVADELEGRFR